MHAKAKSNTYVEGVWMNTREMYEKINGDYEEVMSRLMKEERVIKFLRKFADGNELADMQAALDAED